MHDNACAYPCRDVAPRTLRPMAPNFERGEPALVFEAGPLTEADQAALKSWIVDEYGMTPEHAEACVERLSTP